MKNHLSPLIAAILVFGVHNDSEAQTFTVQATANIYSAGLTNPVAPAGGGAGILPVYLPLTPGQNAFQFSASGSINASINSAYFGPDGWVGNGCIDLAYGGLSGFITSQGLPLVGVFLSNAAPGGTPPATLDFTTSGLGLNFTTLSPSIGQVFFIGDGRTSSNVSQTFFAPTGATRLFLGIADAIQGNSLPGGYGDNSGSFTVTVSAVPEPSFKALVTVGGVLSFLFRRRKS